MAMKQAMKILDVAGTDWFAELKQIFLLRSRESCPSCRENPPTSPFVFGVTSNTTDYSFTDGNGASEFRVSF